MLRSLMSGEKIQNNHPSRLFNALVTLLVKSSGKNIKQIIQEIKLQNVTKFIKHVLLASIVIFS